MTPRYVRHLVFALAVATFALAAVAAPQPQDRSTTTTAARSEPSLLDEMRAQLVIIKQSAWRSKAIARNEAVRTHQDSIWNAADQIERLLAARTTSTRPPPVDVDPAPSRPPPTDDTRPPPTDGGTRPPPDGGTTPPPTADWPEIRGTVNLTDDAYRLDPAESYTAFVATGPTSYMGQMVTLADYGQGVHQGYTFTDCEFRIQSNARRQWGIRAYDVMDWRIARSRFLGPGQEHGAYLSAPGGFVIEDAYFADWGGAGVQVAYRMNEKYPHESSDPHLGDAPSEHTYRRVTIERCGDPESDRFGAYLISEHAAEIDWEGYNTRRINAAVLIEDCLIRGGNLDMDYKGNHIRSTRGILCQSRPSLTIRGTRVELPEPMEDWTIQCWDTDTVLIENSHFEDGVMEFRNAQSVKIVNCTGNAQVKVGTGGWNVFPMPNVTYSGPVTQNYDSTGGR